MQNRLFGLPGRIIFNPLDVKENYGYSLDFALLLSRLFRSWCLDFPCTDHAFFPERLPNHYQGLRRTFSKICTKFSAVHLLDPSRNRFRPDTRIQIKGRKNEHVHPAA
jgi:hypothetical protein